MPSVFRIEMLPALHGDSLWIEYGEADDLNRILIDGGPVTTYKALTERLVRVPGNERFFELIVLTHVDGDHVEGLVRMFADKPLPFSVDKVMFNGWRQMERSHGLLGALQGEFLSALLVNRAASAWDPDADPWVVLKGGALPVVDLPGGMKLTLLSPDVPKLQAMAKAWKKDVVTAGLQPGDLESAWDKLAQRKKFLPKKGLLGTTPDLDQLLKDQFKVDAAKANGSSIAFLAEYGDKSAMFLGDSFPDVVAASLRRLLKARGKKKLKVGAVKVAHHGSKNNTSEELLALIESPVYLISTNGALFKHPDKACIARILKFGKPARMVFNYRSEFTRPWLERATQQKYRYEAQVRKDSELSIPVTL
jgi:beta-lactamase superfamily II metal-dependent hydrolase